MIWERFGIKTVIIEPITNMGKKVIVSAIPENFPIMDNAVPYSKPALKSLLGTIKVETVVKIVVKNPFKQSGKEIIKILKSS